jgi:hypothetical protein
MGLKHNIVNCGRRRGHVREAEEEAVAGVDLGDIHVLVGWQEWEGRVDQRGRARAGGDGGKVELAEAGVYTVVGVIEEAGKGLGKLPAVSWIGDEVAPERGDALEALDRPGGEAGEDLHYEVVREGTVLRLHCGGRREDDCHDRLILPTICLRHGAASRNKGGSRLIDPGKKNELLGN